MFGTHSYPGPHLHLHHCTSPSKGHLCMHLSTLVQANLDLRGSIIVCRKGSPTQASSLDHVSVKTAKAIICLSPTDAGLTADEVDGYVMQVFSQIQTQT